MNVYENPWPIRPLAVFLGFATLLGHVFHPARLTAEDRTAFALANGLRVRLVPNAADKKVAVLLGVRAGIFDEPANIPHVAHIAEHLIVHDLRPDSEEAKAVARWYKGGQANAETLADFMYFDLHVSPEELPLALRVQAMRLHEAQFSRDTLVREVPRALSEVEFLEKSPTGGTGKFALFPFVQAALHGQTDVPLKEKTRSITLENVQDFYRRTFRPDRAILSVIGGFDPAVARKEIKAAFAAIPKPAVPSPPRVAAKLGTHEAQWDAATSHLLVAWPAPAAGEADHAALSLASLLLQQRLFTDAEIAGKVKLPMVSNDVEGLFIVNLQTANGADHPAILKKLSAIIAHIQTPEGLGDIELGMARNALSQMIGPINVDSLQLPAHISKVMARTNVELQKVMREIVWGDLPAYAERARTLDAAAVRAAVQRRLVAQAPAVVFLSPAALNANAGPAMPNAAVKPMNEPWFDPNRYAWMPGTFFGMLGGLWGGVAGTLAQRGKGKAFVLGTGWLFIVVAAGFLIAAIVAYTVGQPYGVWYGLGLPGVLGVILFPSLLPVTAKSYRAAEMRKMQAKDL